MTRSSTNASVDVNSDTNGMPTTESWFGAGAPGTDDSGTCSAIGADRRAGRLAGRPADGSAGRTWSFASVKRTSKSEMSSKAK